MTRKNRVSDEQYGAVARRLHEVARRVGQGTLDPVSVLAGVQIIIEGSEHLDIRHDQDKKVEFRTDVDYNRPENKYQLDDFVQKTVRRPISTLPQDGKAQIKIRLVRFGNTYGANPFQTAAVLLKHGLRHATAKELLSLTEKDNFERLLESLTGCGIGVIVAMGSVFAKEGVLIALALYIKADPYSSQREPEITEINIDGDNNLLFGKTFAVVEL